jgi:hypothetical protein
MMSLLWERRVLLVRYESAIEIVGEAGTVGSSREWINAECELRITHLKEISGETPDSLAHAIATL